MGEEKQGPKTELNPAPKSNDLKGIIISAGLTFLGVVYGVFGKESSDVVFKEKVFLAERQELDSDPLFKPLPHELAVSPDRRLLVGATKRGTILLAGSKNREVFDTFKAFPKPPRSILFSSDSSKILLISDDNIVLLWNLQFAVTNQGKEERVMGRTALFQLPWEPDSVQFSTDNQREVFRHGGEESVFDDQGKKVTSQ
jgi:WD40 repeat protein